MAALKAASQQALAALTGRGTRPARTACAALLRAAWIDPLHAAQTHPHLALPRIKIRRPETIAPPETTPQKER
jgi:hypothetical protein